MCALTCFFVNDTATTEIYTLSLHDALPICKNGQGRKMNFTDVHGKNHGKKETTEDKPRNTRNTRNTRKEKKRRSEEHTSELQSRQYLVCRLLLEKKNTIRL